MRSVSCIFVGLCLAVSAFCAGCASVPAKPAAIPEASDVEKLGIKPLAIRLTAAGNMIDFRYSVVDPQKSLPMFSRKVKTYLVAQATSGTFDVPTNKFGPLRSSSREPMAGKEYFIFFSNPGKIVKRGDKVTVVVGDMRIENLTIE